MSRLHLAVLTHPRYQLIHAVDTVSNHNQRLTEGDGVAQAFVAHLVVADRIDIRHVGQAHAAAYKFGAAEANRILPDLFQKRAGVARHAEGGIAGFFRRQGLETFREGGPQLLDIDQALFTTGCRIANT